MNVYDFDKTIYINDSTTDFYFFCLKRHPKILKYLPSLAVAGIKYLCKKCSKTQMKQTLYKFLNCIDAEEEAEIFWQKHITGIKKWYLEHKKDDDLIISASPVFLLKPICRKLNVSHLIASDVDPKTGKYYGENCHGEEKVRKMYENYGKIVPDEFFSDSFIDTPLAVLAKKSFMVKGEQLFDWDFNNPKIKKYGYDFSK
ncbi:MAG: HAD-IB family phosphatase [Acutalibacteraceae bacterium]